MSRVLREFSLGLRYRIENELEQLAQKAPIKMIFPLVIFIFPAIVILLGAGALHHFVSSL